MGDIDVVKQHWRTFVRLAIIVVIALLAYELLVNP